MNLSFNNNKKLVEAVYKHGAFVNIQNIWTIQTIQELVVMRNHASGVTDQKWYEGRTE